MKATVESQTQFENLDQYEQVNNEFLVVLQVITGVEKENDLRAFMHDKEFTHLIYGFGANSMWVKQKGYSERLIFVEL